MKPQTVNGPHRLLGLRVGREGLAWCTGSSRHDRAGIKGRARVRARVRVRVRVAGGSLVGESRSRSQTAAFPE